MVNRILNILAQFQPEPKDESEGWGKLLPLVILMVLYGLSSLLKGKKKKPPPPQQQPQKRSRPLPSYARKSQTGTGQPTQPIPTTRREEPQGGTVTVTREPSTSRPQRTIAEHPRPTTPQQRQRTAQVKRTSKPAMPAPKDRPPAATPPAAYAAARGRKRALQQMSTVTVKRKVLPPLLLLLLL